jgi:hypothetical protein
MTYIVLCCVLCHSVGSTHLSHSMPLRRRRASQRSTTPTRYRCPTLCAISPSLTCKVLTHSLTHSLTKRSPNNPSFPKQIIEPLISYYSICHVFVVTMIPTRTKGTSIPIVYFPTPGAQHTIIYSHGNATDIGAMYSFYVALARQLNVSTLDFLSMSMFGFVFFLFLYDVRA